MDSIMIPKQLAGYHQQLDGQIGYGWRYDINSVYIFVGFQTLMKVFQVHPGTRESCTKLLQVR